MGWDVIILKVDEKIDMTLDLSYLPAIPLGTKADVLNIIQNVFPGIDVSDPSWIVADGKGYTLQMSLYQGNPVENIIINVHGDKTALKVVGQMCKQGKWKAFDTSEGKFVNFEQNDLDCIDS